MHERHGLLHDKQQSSLLQIAKEGLQVAMAFGFWLFVTHDADIDEETIFVFVSDQTGPRQENLGWLFQSERPQCSPHLA